MVWLKDIERQEAAFPVSEHALAARARQAGLWPAVNLALLRSRATFGKHVPHELTGWSRLNRAVGTDSFRTTGLAGDGRTLGAGTGASTAASLAGLARIVASEGLLPWVAGHGFGRALPPPPPTLEDLRREAGTASDRKAYLDAVAR